MHSETEGSDDEAWARPKRMSPIQFRIRSVLGITAGLAFVAAVVRWFSDFGVTNAVLAGLIIPWAVGSFAGIGCMHKLERSTLLGSILGGVLGLLAWYGGCALVWYPPTHEFLLLLAFGVCGSGIVAGLTSIVAEGLSIRRDS